MKKGIIWGICIAMILICLYFVKPTHGGFYPPCPFLYLTGYYCPGCGSLRGLNCLLHGRILAALDYNPLMVISIPLILYLVISNSRIKINHKYIFTRHLFSPLFYKIFIALIILFGIVRNINAYPFNILAP
jgi:hypothetical protein